MVWEEEESCAKALDCWSHKSKTSTAGVSLEPNEAGRAAEADCEGLAGRVCGPSPRRCHNIICPLLEVKVVPPVNQSRERCWVLSQGNGESLKDFKQPSFII